ncbi:HAD family hydrolase [Halomonas sp. I1]|uniref:HAD family hydrolase n=1 Tax=Halomonas sp. I1 TaxID=393536 RepID=UPI0028DEF7BB|nr:HAD family hydrolase [Halomonas sp. I1]MDT8893506.1 HAD family hydrolase [Halomonas sp. I1]
MTRHLDTRLRALTFDLDDTLWDNQGVMARTEEAHYAWLDGQLADWLAHHDGGRRRFSAAMPIERYQAHRQHLAKAHPLRRGDFTWIRERALIDLLEAFGLSRASAWLWASLTMARFHALRLEVSPYPEAEPLLETLAQRFRLGAITNGNLAFQRLPLSRHFEVTIAAGEMPAPKPDARPFLATLSRLGATPAQALHVGDSWKEDVLPAIRLGMRAAWIAPHAPADTPMPAGVHRLSHIRELPELIARLEEHG